MIKIYLTHIVVSLSLAWSAVLFAQVEPQTSSRLGSSPNLPGVQKPGGKPSSNQSPAPAVPSSSDTNGATTTKADKNAPALSLNDMDRSVQPQDDFFTYANGGWLKRTE